jgi:ABC-type transport system involved in cytochrome c biogenesis ATPase subunit
MKLINSMLTPTAGKLTLGYNIKIGYYDQENRGLSMTKTVFEELRDEYPEKGDLELRSALALFLFTADDIVRPISTLSGGERARLTLAKLILKKVNLLIMDEPTNHLDIGSCEALEEALLAFAKAGHGIAILPEAIVRPALSAGELREISLCDATLAQPRYLLVHKSRRLSEQGEGAVSLWLSLCEKEETR